MIRDDQFIGQLEDYLDAFDGATPLPEHVRDAIHAALPSVRQVRPLPLPLRRLGTTGDRSRAAGWALIAAALTVAIGAGALLNLNHSIGPAATASPTPTASPSQTPTPTDEAAPTAFPSGPAVPPGTLLNDGTYRSCDRGGPPATCLAAGTYTLGNGLLRTRVTINIPSGWFEWDPGAGSQGVLVEKGDIPGGGSGWGVVLSAVGRVSRDPCDATKGSFPVDATSSVDGLVAAMRSWPAFEVGPAQPITIGGASGLQVAVTYTKTEGQCRRNEQGYTGVVWYTPQGTPFDAYPMVAEKPNAYTGQFAILDVNAELLVVRSSDFPQTSPFEVSQGIAVDRERHRSDQPVLHDIVDSIQFGPGS